MVRSVQAMPNDEGGPKMATDAELSRRIEQIKTKLQKLGDLRPGTLSEQYNTCRTPGCRCKADPPQRHGPYHQLSYTRNGRSRTENVRPEDLAAVRAQLRNYAELRGLVEEWIDAAIELDRLRRSEKRSAPPRRAGG
jgi:hypothetical protein